MDAIFFVCSRRAGVACLAVLVLGLAVNRASAAAAPENVNQMAADLKSGDAAKIAKAEAQLKANVEGGNGDYGDWPLFDLMDNLGLAKDVDAMCGEAVVRRPNSGNLDQLMIARINALLKEGKKDEALAVSKSFYDAASLEGTADAVRMVTQCLVVDTPPEQKLASRFKRQQIAWASVAPPGTQPAGGDSGGTGGNQGGNPAAAPRRGASAGAGSGGDDLGEPVLAGIKADAGPYEEAIKKIDPVDFGGFLTKGNLLLLADRPGEARVAFEQAADIAENDGGHLLAVEGIARAIRAQSGCVGPANAYILSLKNQK